jgi:hypothetical protein
MPLFDAISTLEITFFTFYDETFTPPRHKDAKMNINQKVARFALCLGAFVAICSPPVADPGYGFINLFDKSRKKLTYIISMQKT